MVDLPEKDPMLQGGQVDEEIAERFARRTGHVPPGRVAGLVPRLHLFLDSGALAVSIVAVGLADQQIHVPGQFVHRCQRCVPLRSDEEGDTVAQAGHLPPDLPGLLPDGVVGLLRLGFVDVVHPDLVQHALGLQVVPYVAVRGDDEGVHPVVVQIGLRPRVSDGEWQVVGVDPMLEQFIVIPLHQRREGAGAAFGGVELGDVPFGQAERCAHVGRAR